MSKTASSQLELGDTTDESDDNCDCDDLPDGFPCAECFITGDAEFVGVA